jgi:hypothetical protein
VKTVLKYAARELGLIDRNPWEGIDITFKTTNKRRPWTDAELKTFFTQPLHTDYTLPTDNKAGADAAYWIPLLGLRVRDVEASESCPLLSITDEGDAQSVKSQAGVRKVPIHSELLRLGFLDYVAVIKASDADLLWPVLNRPGIRGGHLV